MSADAQAIIDAPASAELALLREIRAELREEREETQRQLRAMRADLDVVIQAQRELAAAQGFELVAPMGRRASSVPAPPHSGIRIDDRL